MYSLIFWLVWHPWLYSCHLAAKCPQDIVFASLNLHQVILSLSLATSSRTWQQWILGHEEVWTISWSSYIKRPRFWTTKSVILSSFLYSIAPRFQVGWLPWANFQGDCLYILGSFLSHFFHLCLYSFLFFSSFGDINLNGVINCFTLNKNVIEK